jgi:hypothetical protein
VGSQTEAVLSVCEAFLTRVPSGCKDVDIRREAGGLYMVKIASTEGCVGYVLPHLFAIREQLRIQRMSG